MLDPDVIELLIELAQSGGPVGTLVVLWIIYQKFIKKDGSNPEAIAEAVEASCEAKLKTLPCQMNPRLYEEITDYQGKMDSRFDEVKKEVVATRLEVAGLKGEMRARGVGPT